MSANDWKGVGDDRPVAGRDQKGSMKATPTPWKGQDDSRPTSESRGGAASVPISGGTGPAKKGGGW
jgi:hypothetical protein